ncbi:MAG TPA: MG2 domain-containing protein [Anaerolineae bacterium]|nr:MG2 domain-containing protein [Anaerolineae bacterium]
MRRLLIYLLIPTLLALTIIITIAGYLLLAPTAAPTATTTTTTNPPTNPTNLTPPTIPTTNPTPPTQPADAPTTDPSTLITTTNLQGPINIAQPITLHFPQPINMTTINNHLTLSPSANYTLSWNEQQTTLTLIPSFFDWQTTYTLTLNPDITTQQNNTLFATSQQWTFTTPARNEMGVSSFGPGSRLQIITSDQPHVLPTLINSTKQDTVELRLYQLATDTFINFAAATANQYVQTSFDYLRSYPHPLTTPTTPIIASWEHPITPDNPTFPQLPDNLPNGLYLLESRIPPSYVADQLILLITPLGLTIQQHHNSYHLQTHNLTTLTTTPTDIIIYDQTGTPLHQATTDDHGRYQYTPLPDEIPHLIVAQQDNALIVVPLNDNWPTLSHQTPRQHPTPPNDYLFHTFTNRSTYYPQDQIDVKIIARRLDHGQPLNPPTNTPLEITLIGPDEATLATQIVNLNDYGTATTSFQLPATATNGRYHLQTTLDNHTHHDSFSILPRDPDPTTITPTPPPATTDSTPPPLQLTLNQPEYDVGQTAQLAITSLGDGPAQLTLSYNGQIEHQDITLTPPLTTIDIPIMPAHHPNLYATVTSWQPNPSSPTTTNDQNGLITNHHQYHSATAELTIIDPSKQLNLTLLPAQTNFPAGQTSDITLKATNAQGVPIAAEIAVAIVPVAAEGSYHRLNPLYTTFYPPTPFDLTQYDSHTPTRAYHTNDGGGSIMPTYLAPPRPLPNTYWFPTLRTDALGQTTITIPWPATPTTWHLTAHALTADTQVGTLALTLTTQ